MALKQITYDKLLKKGDIIPSEKTELTQALDLGGEIKQLGLLKMVIHGQVAVKILSNHLKR